jgi:hypothetical protein
MTEATQQEQQREQSPYTQFRDSFPLGEDSHNDPKMAVHWRDADRWRQTLRDQIADISSDPELSDEGKQSRMEATYSRLAPRIEQESKAAKQKAAKLAAEPSVARYPSPSMPRRETPRFMATYWRRPRRYGSALPGLRSKRPRE